MKRYRFSDLSGPTTGHFLGEWLSGERLYAGGLSFHPPGHRTHSEGHHTHEDQESFCILQGRGILELEGEHIPVRAGDVIIIEPGENHHLVSDRRDPIINLWLHANAEGHPNQRPEESPS